jgi:hypothetical protein
MKNLHHILRQSSWLFVLALLSWACSAESNGEIKEGSACNQVNLLSNKEVDPEGNSIKEVNLTNKSDQKMTFTIKITEKSKEQKETRSETYTLAPGATVNLGCTGRWNKNILKGEEWYMDYDYEIVDAVEEE